MLIYSILFLLLSNAVTLRRDKSILFSRVAIIVLLYSSLIAFNCLYFACLDSGIGLYGGLFHDTTTTHVFHTFIFLISILTLPWLTKLCHTTKKLTFKLNNIVLSSYLTITISILTLIIVLFIFTPQE